MQAVIGRNRSARDTGSEVPTVSLVRDAGKMAVYRGCAMRGGCQQLRADHRRNTRGATVGADHQICMNGKECPILPAHRNADDPAACVTKARLDRGPE